MIVTSVVIRILIVNETVFAKTVLVVVTGATKGGMGPPSDLLCRQGNGPLLELRGLWMIMTTMNDVREHKVESMVMAATKPLFMTLLDNMAIKTIAVIRAIITTMGTRRKHMAATRDKFMAL
ncbi:uncharacterized protein LOC125034485 [Penaeus chinensis]|uniref:uncharacterized protein LOC125034485 n=1 Tax=Penaeus chinensis TaxID=139456 RepID=UPI001FB5F99A|nr:uncharacterized protein LOC125034485 [Penaeus chinensis]